MATSVLDAPRARTQIKLVRDGFPAAKVCAPAAARLAVYQAGMTVAQSGTNTRAARCLQIRRAIAANRPTITYLQCVIKKFHK